MKEGERFAYRGINFIALGEEQGGIMALAEPIGNVVFSKENKNDWRVSDVRKYLNGEWVKKLDKADLIEFESDLTSDCGQTDYGTSKDYVALLSDGLYRKYRETVLCWLNDYDIKCLWHLTPWRTPSAGTASYVRLCYAGSGGALDLYGASDSNGAAPLVIINPAAINRLVRDAESEALKAENERLKEYIGRLENLLKGISNAYQTMKITS